MGLGWNFNESKIIKGPGSGLADGGNPCGILTSKLVSRD
jgi:hypothetical protein